MKIAILARERYCARVLEFLQNTTQGKIEFTGTKIFNGDECAIFIFESAEAEVINTEIWIKGEFSSFDVITFRFVNDLPQLPQ